MRQTSNNSMYVLVALGDVILLVGTPLAGFGLSQFEIGKQLEGSWSQECMV